MKYSVGLLAGVLVVTMSASGCCHLRRFTRESSCVSVGAPSGATIANYREGAVIDDAADSGVVTDWRGAPPPVAGTMDVFGDEYESIPVATPVPGMRRRAIDR